jgi:LysR family glycine cleavage system transcriptional activator
MTTLPVFEAVGQQLSIARAAEALHLTPGAVSRQIQNLESFLGLKLFERGHRRIVFTREGEEYWARIHGALGEVRNATRIASAHAAESPLTIAAPRMFLQRFIMPELGKLYALHPDMRITFVTSGTGTGAVDGTVAISPGVRQGYSSDILGEANLSPVCSPRYLENAPPLEVPADLARHTLLRSQEYMRNWLRWLGADAQDVLSRARCIDFESPGLEVTGAHEGVGIAVVRLALVRDELAQGKLVALFPDHIVRETYEFTFASSKLRMPMFQKFRRWINKTIQTSAVYADIAE